MLSRTAVCGYKLLSSARILLLTIVRMAWLDSKSKNFYENKYGQYICNRCAFVLICLYIWFVRKNAHCHSIYGLATVDGLG